MSTVVIMSTILDGIEKISKSIDNIGEIVAAVNTGQKYLEQRYKTAKNDVRKILEEINKTLITMSSATSIVTHFAFVYDPARYTADPRAFDYRIANCKSEMMTLRQNIKKHQGHGSKIERYVNNIKRGTKLDNIFSIFGIESKEENEKLSSKLQDIYVDEEYDYFSVYYGENPVYLLCEKLELALDHIHETLGPGLKVPGAAMLLAEYGKAFMKVESSANYRVLQIRELIRELS